MTSCIASGFRRSASRDESTMSQKSTVTCFRSPSSAALEVRILSARCLGVYVSGPANRDPAGGVTPKAVPHPPQNFTPGSFEKLHEGQARANEDPHSAQNRRPTLLTVPQRGQVISFCSLPARVQKQERRNEERSPFTSELRLPPASRVPTTRVAGTATRACRFPTPEGVWKIGQADNTSPHECTSARRSRWLSASTAWASQRC